MISASAQQKVGNDRRAFRRNGQGPVIYSGVIPNEDRESPKRRSAEVTERPAIVPYLGEAGTRSLRPVQARKRRRSFWQPYERPIFGILNQPCPHGVLKNVSAFFIETLVVSQAMIKEVGLPANIALRRHPALPFRDDLRHDTLLRKADEGVAVIWHRGKNMDPPCAGLVATFDRFSEERPKLRISQLVYSPRLAANGNKPDLRNGVEPRRRIVWKRLASCHGWMIDRLISLSRSWRSFENFFRLSYCDGTPGGRSLPLSSTSP